MMGEDICRSTSTHEWSLEHSLAAVKGTYVGHSKLEWKVRVRVFPWNEGSTAICIFYTLYH